MNGSLSSLRRRLLPLAIRCQHALLAATARLHGSRSQFGQDLWVLRMLGGTKGGWFLDIGASDGKTFSNTYILEKNYGWRGLCVEANPAFFAQLTMCRSAICDNSCLFSERRMVQFLDGGKEYGGIRDTLHPGSDRLMQRCLGTGDIGALATITMETRTVADLLKHYDCPTTIDYISLDTEGSEYDILRGFPFSTHRFLCMTVEHQADAMRKNQIHALMTEHGYIRAEEHTYEDYYCHPSLRIAA